jgi:hypothetical protein
VTERLTFADIGDRETVTVEEGGQVLGIGRRLAYEAAHLYLETGGREGLPVLRLGPRRLVVPVARLRVLLGETNGNGSPTGLPNGSG